MSNQNRGSNRGGRGRGNAGRGQGFQPQQVYAPGMGGGFHPHAPQGAFSTQPYGVPAQQYVPQQVDYNQGGRGRGPRPPRGQQSSYHHAQTSSHHGGGGGGPAPGGVAPQIARNFVHNGVIPVGSPILSSAVWPEGNELYLGCADGVVRVYNLEGESKAESQEQGTVSVMSAAGGGWLFVGCVSPAAGLVKAYNMADKPPSMYSLVLDPMQGPYTHQGPVSAICAVQSYLLTGGGDGAIRVWQFDGKEWKMSGALGGGGPAHLGAAITALASTPDMNAVSASAAGDIKVWSMSGNGALLSHWPLAHLGGVGTLMVVPDPASPSHSLVVSSGLSDNLVKVWTAAGACKTLTNSAKSTVTTVRAVPLNPATGQLGLVVGFSNAGLQLVDLATFKKVGWLDGHKRSGVGRVTSISCVPGLLFACFENGVRARWRGGL
jgi:WD40 repeat protein